ncbi:MAG: hypothetical protein AB1755_06620, partial [Candidatus Omnitrophota bacterium]
MGTKYCAPTKFMIKSNKIFRKKFYGLNLGNSPNFARRILSIILVAVFFSNSIAFGALDGSSAPLRQAFTPWPSGFTGPSFISLRINQNSIDSYFNFGLDIPRNVETHGNASLQLDYFLTCLNNKLEDFWVNLNPNEPNRVIGKGINQTSL